MIRIAHFTDLHVTEKPSRIPWRTLVSKRFLGWVNLAILGRHRVFADAPEIGRALVEDLESLRPDAIVSTGDLTGISLESEFTKAREILAPLLKDDRVTGIPGNHDVYVPSAEMDRLYEKSFGSWTRTDLASDDFPRELRALYPYPLLRRLGEATALFAIRDVRPAPYHDSSGLVGPAQLAALDALLDHPLARGKTKILALHYGLCRADRSPDGRFHGLRDVPALVEVIRRRGVALVIHGHLHRRFVLTPTEAWPFAIANPGSVASGKPHHSRAYHILSVDRGRIELEARRLNAASGRFEAWPEAPGTGQIVG